MENPEWRLLDSDLDEVRECARIGDPLGPTMTGDLVREIDRLRLKQQDLLDERDQLKRQLRTAPSAAFSIGDATVKIDITKLPEFLAVIQDADEKVRRAKVALETADSCRAQDVARLMRERDAAQAEHDKVLVAYMEAREQQDLLAKERDATMDDLRNAQRARDSAHQDRVEMEGKLEAAESQLVDAKAAAETVEGFLVKANAQRDQATEQLVAMTKQLADTTGKLWTLQQEKLKQTTQHCTCTWRLFDTGRARVGPVCPKCAAEAHGGVGGACYMYHGQLEAQLVDAQKRAAEHSEECKAVVENARAKAAAEPLVRWSNRFGAPNPPPEERKVDPAAFDAVCRSEARLLQIVKDQAEDITRLVVENRQLRDQVSR